MKGAPEGAHRTAGTTHRGCHWLRTVRQQRSGLVVEEIELWHPLPLTRVAHSAAGVLERAGARQ